MNKLNGTTSVHVRLYDEDLQYIKVHYPLHGFTAEFVRQAVRQAVIKHKKENK